jgi:hypothetical protein
VRAEVRGESGKVAKLVRLIVTLVKAPAALNRFRGLLGQLVGTPTRVGIQIGEPLVFALQRIQQRQQGDVLVDVGEIPCVKAVTVFHPAMLFVAGGRGCLA